MDLVFYFVSLSHFFITIRGTVTFGFVFGLWVTLGENKLQYKMPQIEAVSCGFVDTFLRLDTRNDVENKVRKWTKAALFLWTIYLVWNVLTKSGDEDLKSWRMVAVMAMVTLYQGKAVFQLLYLTRRRIGLTEMIVEGGVLVPIGFILLAYLARKDVPLWSYEAVCFPVMFGAGLFIQLAAELERGRFKRENPKTLYVTGRFQSCRHINYFGEILMVWAISFMTGRIWSLIWAAIVTARMLLFCISELEYYLSIQYTSEWPEYVRRTPSILVPNVF